MGVLACQLVSRGKNWLKIETSQYPQLFAVQICGQICTQTHQGILGTEPGLLECAKTEVTLRNSKHSTQLTLTSFTVSDITIAST